MSNNSVYYIIHWSYDLVSLWFSLRLLFLLLSLFSSLELNVFSYLHSCPSLNLLCSAIHSDICLYLSVVSRQMDERKTVVIYNEKEE